MRWRSLGIAAVLLAACFPTPLPSPSPSPSTVAPAPPSATPSATAAPASLGHIDMCATSSGTLPTGPLRSGERYGFASGNELWLEGDDKLLAVLDGAAVVAPDGRAIALWARDPLAATNAAPTLTLIDLLSGRSRAIAVSDDARGATVAWSCDGSALLLGAVKTAPAPSGGVIIDAPPAEYTSLRIVDIATGSERELARIPKEAVVPLAWNPKLKLGAAIIERRFAPSAYLTVTDAGQVRTWELPEGIAERIHTDPAVSSVVAIGLASDTTALYRWPIDDGSRLSTRRPDPGWSVVDAQPLTGTRDAVAVVRQNLADGTQNVQVWPESPQAPARGLVPPGSARADATDIEVRPDGAAYVARSSYQTGLLDLARAEPTGQVTVLDPSPMIPPVGRPIVIAERALSEIRPSTLQASVSRKGAIDRVTALTDRVLRTDRTDAKLIQWRDLFRVGPFTGVARSAAAPGSGVWVVALAGRIRTAGPDGIPLRWGVWLMNAETGAIIDFTTDARELWAWPYWWDALIDRGPDPPIRTLPAPARGRPADLVPRSPCGFVTGTMREAGQLVWLIDCGPEGNADARKTIGPMLEFELWTPCGSGLASATWRRGETLTTVSEGSGTPPNYIRLTQRPRGSEC